MTADPAGFPLLAGGPYMPDGITYTAALLDTYLTAKIDALYALVPRPAVSRLEDADGSSVPNATGTPLGSYSMGQTYVNDPLAVLSHASGTQTLGKVGRWRWTLSVTRTALAGTVPAHHFGVYVYLNGAVVPNAPGSWTEAYPATTVGWPTQNITTGGTVITTAITDTLQAVVYQNSGSGGSIDTAVFEVELVP